MNNCLLFVLLKNFNISSLHFIILSVFFKNNINVSHVILKFMKNIIYWKTIEFKKTLKKKIFYKLLIIIFGKSSFNLYFDVFDSITNIFLKNFLNPWMNGFQKNIWKRIELIFISFLIY